MLLIGVFPELLNFTKHYTLKPSSNKTALVDRNKDS